MGEDVTERLRPFPVSVDDKPIIQITCGGMHTLALTQDALVYSWGVNDEGALGRETSGEMWEKSGKSTGKPGDAYIPGLVTFPPTTSDSNSSMGKIVQLSGGDSHSIALSDKGSVWGWGTYRDGSGVMGFSPSTRIQLSPVCIYNPSSQDDQIIRVASGADHTMALTRSGTLLSWGSGQQGQLGRVGERVSERVKMETYLTPHPIVIKKQRGVASTHIIDVFCGTYDTFALTSSGAVYTWGLNNYGQLSLAGQMPLFAPTFVKALVGRDVAAVRPGQHHTLVLTNQHSLLSFGRPTYGRLGQRDAEIQSDAACPEVKGVDGLEGVKVVGGAAGLAVSGCFDEEGNGWVWGFGTSNQLGKGDDDEDEIVPRKLGETKKFLGQKIVQMEFGGQHVALLCIPK